MNAKIKAFASGKRQNDKTRCWECKSTKDIQKHTVGGEEIALCAYHHRIMTEDLTA